MNYIRLGTVINKDDQGNNIYENETVANNFSNRI